jgi:hypothetical protein
MNDRKLIKVIAASAWTRIILILSCEYKGKTFHDEHWKIS